MVPTESPADVLDRVLDKGIVTGVSLRLEDAPIALVETGDRLVAEVDVYLHPTWQPITRAA
jgi:hypothetical protein